MTFGVRTVVEDLQGQQAVAVLGEELLEVLDVAARLFLVVARAFKNRVETEVVHGDFGASLEFDQERAEVGVVEEFDGGFLERGGGCFDLGDGRLDVFAHAVGRRRAFDGLADQGRRFRRAASEVSGCLDRTCALTRPRSAGSRTHRAGAGGWRVRRGPASVRLPRATLSRSFSKETSAHAQ